MAGLIGYLLKSALCLALFYSFFILFMKKTTFFRFNRTAFFIGTVLCLLLPLFPISFYGDGVTANDLIDKAVYEMVLHLDGGMADGVVVEAGRFSFAAVSVIVYFTGLLAVIVSVGISYVKMSKIIRRSEGQEKNGCRIVVSDMDMPSFSWGRTIVIGRKDMTENPAVLTHEMMHVRSWHSLDIIAYSLVTAVQWFNPLVWLAFNELKMLHEYEADELTIQKGIDATKYQLLLVKKAVGDKRFQLANGFNHSKLKNRITMMQKNKTSNWMRFAYILCLPVLFGAMCSFEAKADVISIGEAAEVTDEVPVGMNETAVKPVFQGGDWTTFSNWVAGNLKYPEEAVKKKMEGEVYVQFTVSATGKVVDVRILRGVSPELDAEVVRVVSSSPDWTPGQTGGKNVAVRNVIPIIFKLK